jgi:hypothetical protein
MRCYGYKFAEVLDLPIRAFHLLSRNIDRLTAEDDYRMARVVALAMSGGEGLNDLFEQLRKQMGQTVIYEDEPADEISPKYRQILEMKLDQDGLQSLKGLGRL